MPTLTVGTPSWAAIVSPLLNASPYCFSVYPYGESLFFAVD